MRRSAGLNEALAAARAGGTLVVPKPDGTTGAYSMLEDITGESFDLWKTYRDGSSFHSRRSSVQDARSTAEKDVRQDSAS